VQSSNCLTNEGFLRSIFLKTVKRKLIGVGVSVEYIVVDLTPYRDAGKEKFALYVVFVQDYASSDPDLESEILELLIKKAEAHNVSELVNDISVNLLQWHKNRVVQHKIGGNDDPQD
jgi:hypothetical protein